jgi:hypothetical protein
MLFFALRLTLAMTVAIKFLSWQESFAQSRLSVGHSDTPWNPFSGHLFISWRAFAVAGLFEIRM